MSATLESARQEWAERRHTVNLLMRLEDVNRVEFAERVGMKRPTLNNRLDGKTAISMPELRVMADHLGVPIDVLLMSPVEANLWVLQNRPGIIRNRCFPESPQVAA